MVQFSCNSSGPRQETTPEDHSVAVEDAIAPPRADSVVVPHDIPLRTYFEFMDSLVARLDSLLSYPISEHLLVWANPWLIDTLVNTDYYRLQARGIFSDDPGSLPALRRGDRLLLPDSLMADSIANRLAATVIDVNIPEFRLRIIENGQTLYSFPVRVGRVEKTFLAMAGREVDLRTMPGVGKVVRINRHPTFINPEDNKPYAVTRRDDGKVTKLPLAPWIEPELDGHRFGQLIHPTTNPATLGNAYSNGCIGMQEGDMWRLYYHARIGTPVVVRYDLLAVNELGDTVRLKNIYPGFERRQQRQEVIASAVAAIQEEGKVVPVCDCKAQHQ